MNIYKSLH